MATLLLVLVVALATSLAVGKSGAWQKVVGLALAIYPTLLIANALTLWWFFHKVESALITAGWVVNPYLLKAATGALALLLYAVTPIVLTAFIKRDKWTFVVLFGSLWCGMNILLFFASAPTPEQAVNPFTGDYLFKYYKDAEKNCVERFPRSMEFHPNHIGIKLAPPDETIVSEWRAHPCEAAGIQTNDPKHQFVVDKIVISFVSCDFYANNATCNFSALNTNSEDIKFTWYSKIQAIDSQGNTHDPSSLNVGNKSWPMGIFFRDEFDDEMEDLLIPQVSKTLSVGFKGVYLEYPFRNLRLPISYITGFMHLKTLKTLDFSDLPIVQRKLTAEEKALEEVRYESPYLVKSYTPETRGVRGSLPDKPDKAQPSDDSSQVMDVGVFGDVKQQGAGQDSVVSQQLKLPKSVTTQASTQGQPHLEIKISNEIEIHNVAMENSPLLEWQVSSNQPWLIISRDVSGQEHSGKEGAGGHSRPALKIKVGSSGMQQGTYSATITITTNDSQNPMVIIPVKLIIGARSDPP